MYQEYGDRAGFLLVYIREAHPADEWQMDSNVKEGVVINQPQTPGERAAAAGKIAYAGSRSPRGFKPEEVEGWLERIVGR